MKAGVASSTAISTAALRAAHLLLFDAPKIFEDTLALDLTGLETRENLRAFLHKRPLPDLERVSAYFALRHRFSEDRLWQALKRGVRQVVLLGAGLDTLALRHPDLLNRVRFIEVDHPDSQAWKRERLSALGLAAGNVDYVQVDFATQDLAGELSSAGIEPDVPTFFAWLGVTQYISEDAVTQTLSLAARHAPASEIVFDVIRPLDGLPPDEFAISDAARAFSTRRGEPWLSYFTPEALDPNLRAMGYSQIMWLTKEEAAIYYAGQRTSPLTAWQLIAAVV